MPTFRSNDLSYSDWYRLLTGAIVPRPIALVSTISPTGVVNLAPFSFFNGVASRPPSVMLSISPKRSGEPKDTWRNIQETRQFVVNIVSESIAEPMHQSSAEYPYGISEMEKVGLTPLASLQVRPPRVKESLIHFECELYGHLPVGDGGPGSSILVVGQILVAHIDERCWREGPRGKQISIEALQPIARLGGASYSKIGEIFELKLLNS